MAAQQEWIGGTAYERHKRLVRERQEQERGRNMPTFRYGLPVYPNVPETPQHGPWNSGVRWTSDDIQKLLPDGNPLAIARRIQQKP